MNLQIENDCIYADKLAKELMIVDGAESNLFGTLNGFIRYYGSVKWILTMCINFAL